MRKLVLKLIFTIFCLGQLHAQYFDWEKMMAKYMNEISFGAGATNFLGELGGLDKVGSDFLMDFEWPASRWNVHVGYKHNFDKYWAFRTTLTVGELAGDDRWTKEFFRNNRNLNFKTTLVELNALLYFYFFRERPSHIYKIKKANGLNGRPFSMYAFGGIGVFYYNPKGKSNGGTWVKLRPLGTEGQNSQGGPSKYSNFSVSIPAGLGISYMFNLRWKIAIEASYHKTFTDYIDDVSTVYFDTDLLYKNGGQQAVDMADPSGGSRYTQAGLQRGDPTDLDAFFYCNLTVYHALEKKKKRGYSPYRKRKRRASF